MVSVSNKTVVVLLGVALMVTLVGTFLSVTQLFDRASGPTLLTGAATDSASGTSTVTISATTSMTNNEAETSFGSGYANASSTNCMLTTEGTQNLSDGSGHNDCIGFNNTNVGFLLENTGNQNISVNYTCAGSCSSETFIGGNKSNFEIRALTNSAYSQLGEQGVTDTIASCPNEGTGNAKLNNTYVNVTAAGHWLCGNQSWYSLQFGDQQDAIVVHLNVTISPDAATGAQQTATFTFNALGQG
jgi:hypothetical protein